MPGIKTWQIVFSAIVLAGAAAAQIRDTDWPNYGNDPGGMRYSPLSQIDRENVSKLKVAWIFHTGDISDGTHDRRRSGFEATPIFVDGTLYLTTGFNRVIALDPERCTGRVHAALKAVAPASRRLSRGRLARAPHPRSVLKSCKKIGH